MEKVRTAEERRAEEEAKAQRQEERYARWKEEQKQMSESESKNGAVEETKSKKRKRHKKGKKKSAEVSNQETLDVQDAEDEPASHKYRYDESLLAIIGVLDALKFESNVAGWIRSGRLWAVGVSSPAIESIASSRSTKDGSGSDVSVQDDREKKKRKTDPRDDDDDDDATADQAMWLSHEPTMDHWSRKGREALDIMGIEVIPGIER
jgi:hypothetical protein